MKNKQVKIYKISTKRFKATNWDLKIDYKTAFELDELVSLFDSQTFRLIEQIIGKSLNGNGTNVMCSVVIDKKSDFRRAVSKKGILLNNQVFKRFVGTTGGLKANTLLFVRADILDELNKKCECGLKKGLELVPAKYEAYKALTSSASVPIVNPKKILVVKDCIVKYKEDVIEVDDTMTDEINQEPIVKVVKDMDLENNTSDGYNLCTIEYMQEIAKSLDIDYTPSGVCLRNAWLKGMLYPFPIKEFAERFSKDNYIVKDIWGNDCDIREVDLILTESSLKLWYGFDNISDYVEKYNQNGYCFSVTKVAPRNLEDIRTLNYQYLQSYIFNDEDMYELCKPTIDWLKGSLCGDYEATLDFLGVNENTREHDYTRALYLDKRFIKDPYVIDRVRKLISKKVDGAKVGKLLCNGNYQLLSGDPFALMQSIFGLKISGLLNKGECYSNYWVTKNVKEVVCFRSPMTNHNNIRRVEIKNDDECNYWYKYMQNIFIVNGFDSFCMATNGCDFDGDTIYTTNNNILLKNHRKLPAVVCVQKTAEKKKINEASITLSNYNGLGNQVGTITNRATSMIDIQSNFHKDDENYKKLDYRIICSQNYQQNSID